jgi:membrane protease YdiL (CAAX protease family)
VYALLMVTLWTPRSAQLSWLLLTTSAVLAFSMLGPFSFRQLGVRWGLPRDAAALIAVAALLALSILFCGRLLGLSLRFGRWPSWKSPVGYIVWAFLQQFLLQSFFFLRLERILGAGKKPVFLATLLFAVAHLPNPALTAATVLGGAAATEVFRRQRSILALGLAHALIGLALAVTLPEPISHHMKVGLGYLH